ncbi:hypothetical protein OIY81_468 [Cryptosporidium canis]|uniref:Uncharacterized protein n=1 Tax=Cryptosporidium canis TaxID=195482 RepID=A0ABQ8PAY8_9CRYT|nr:hypothetical protein OIY81_468 [Cryptosporidium canis]KAJ1614490.1 hypothetical protein OJ252_616 [Cryptosporidium canis]
MKNNDELNLLSVKFNAGLALDHLENVFIPENTPSLDNISKAALLLPFGIQKELKIFAESSSLNESFDNKTNSDENSTRKQLNKTRNIEFKLNMKKKFSDKKKKFNNISNLLANKFSIKSRDRLSSTELKQSTYFSKITGREVSCLSNRFNNH